MHREALSLLEPVASRPGAPAPRRLRLGQLLLWTGQHREAVAVLEPLAEAEAPAVEALDALVDAYRAAGRPADAWRVGRRIAAGASKARRLELVEVAIEADEPEAALALVQSRPPAGEKRRNRLNPARNRPRSCWRAVRSPPRRTRPGR